MTTKAAGKEQLFSLEAYLALEEKALYRHEFHNGKILEMAGGTDAHSEICTNLATLLNLYFFQQEAEWHVYNSDLKVFIPLLNKAVYPDLSVVSGAPVFHAGKRHLLLNPCLIIEVLSASTADYDRSGKFSEYRSLPSLREYVIVSHEKPLVESFFLQDPEQELWKIIISTGLEASIDLPSIGCKLSLKDIYRQVKFETDEMKG
ncbi:MAG: Uma2 family endonuclease [Saprospiraceae bacterium]|nr:Uma2 family endonuclease [Saprospiraceae bacterium]MDZ4705444.1 Uma2 family endonuclease [Saprospiraceae bacterium]